MMYTNEKKQVGATVLTPLITLKMSAVVILASLMIFYPSPVESAPQYPGTFIKTNHSRHVTHAPGIDGQRRNGHRERHSATQVQTTTGLLHGIRRNVMGKDVHIYLGVPYAKPPLGPLRFKKPIPLEPWNGTFYATNQVRYTVDQLMIPEFLFANGGAVLKSELL